MNRIFFAALLSAVLMLLVECKPAGNITKSPDFRVDSSLIGNFQDDYKIRYTITNNSFTQHPGVVYHILSYNEKEQYFIARNDTSNISDAGLYTRIDFMNFNNMAPWTWGFCLTAYKAASFEEALRTAAADRNNPKKGCGGYPFSRMRRIDPK